MQVEEGSIFEGKVTGITNFGAFVELPNGQTGMVHISEVAFAYVTDIREHLTENQAVKVKVLSVGEDGKISLSIKRAQTPPAGAQKGRPSGGAPRTRTPRPAAVSPGRPGSFEWQPASTGTSFEDMMSHFKQTSDEKISDLKKSSEGRRGGYSRRGGNHGGGFDD